MYEIKENRRKLFDGTEITTYTRDVVSANILQQLFGGSLCRQRDLYTLSTPLYRRGRQRVSAG